MKMKLAQTVSLVLLVTAIASLAQEQQEQEQEQAPGAESDAAGGPQAWVQDLRWRCIGPALQGGRVTDLEVSSADPFCFYVGSASGGVFKTTDGGITFAPIFDHVGSLSTGDLCTAPSNPEIVWVGTGEANVRNSVSWGDGVYRSLDGGKTWEHKGLEHTRHIGRIAIHPANPEIVYVAAHGRLWGESSERGLYRSEDGGRSWERILAVDERTGCGDVALSPGDPNIVLAAMYERERDATDDNDPVKRWGPGGGIYRSGDGGRSWERIWQGLPTVPLGRVCFDFHRADPAVVFAVIETSMWAADGDDAVQKRRAPRATLGLEVIRRHGEVVVHSVAEGSPAARAGLIPGDRLARLDGEEIKTSVGFRRDVGRLAIGEKVALVVARSAEGEEEREIEVELVLAANPSQSRRITRPHSLGLGGQRGDVQDKQGEAGYQTGGVYRSGDGGVSWERVNSLNPRPYYFSQIRVDPTDPAVVYVCGTELHISRDGGKSFSSRAGRGTHLDHHALWIDPANPEHLLLGNDGGIYESFDRSENWNFVNVLPIGQFYHVAVGPRRAYHVYGGLQDNGSIGGPSMLRGSHGPSTEDWFQFGAGDGFVCAVDPERPELVYYESQGGAMMRLDLRTGEAESIRPERREGEQHRFNWKTPFALSHHNPRIFYCAGNYVFRSLDRGRQGRSISPEITRTEQGSATAFCESPRDAEILYAGTDDGKLWVTRDGGREWVDVTAKLPDVPGPRWVSSIEASHHSAERAYVTLDGHRSDDDAPYVFVTEDAGESWKSLSATLPATSTRVIREDVENANLLYLGTEFGMWVSLDRGKGWMRIEKGLPSVAVHEFAQHPTAGELVVATHGRSLWILDVVALRQMSSRMQRAERYLFEPATAVDWNPSFSRRLSGHRHFIGGNRTRGAVISYMLKEPVDKLRIEIQDAAGELLRSYDQKERAAGLHHLVWDLRQRIEDEEKGDEGRSRRGRGSRPRMRKVEPGTYRVVLVVGEERSKPREFELIPDPEPEVDVGSGFVRQSPIR